MLRSLAGRPVQRYPRARVDGYVSFILARPRAVIACVLLLTAVLGAELRHLEPHVNLRDLMPQGHPYRGIDDRLRDDFGAGQTALLAVQVAQGDVFTAETLRRVERLTAAVEELPGVEPSSVLSLASRRAKAFVADPDGVRIEPLLGEVSSDPAALRALRETVFSHPAYVGHLVAPDGRGALVLADFAESERPERTTRALEALAAAESADGTLVLVGGQSPALAALQDATRRIAPLLLLALGIIALVHYEAFRTLQAVVLPLVTAALSVVWAMGLTSLLGVRVTPWTAVTAVLVLSVAAGHAVQILKRYYECYAELGDNRAAVAASLARIGPVTVTACFIAAAGFASLATFGVPAVRDFGLMAACGITSALVLELTFIPCVRVLLRAPRSAEARRERERHLLDALIERIGRAVTARPGVVLAAGLAFAGGVGLGIGRIHVNTAFRSWFDRDEPVIVADRAIREAFTGTSTIRVRIEGAGPDALVDPAALRGIAALQRVLAEEPDVTATLSVADHLQLLNRAMHDGDPAAYAIPDDPALVEQYLLLLDPEDLERVLTFDRRAAAIHALARSDDVAWVQGVFARLRTTAERVMPPGVRVEVAGGELAQAAANNETVVHEKLLNMLQVSLVICALSALVFRSLVAGALVLVPLLCAVLVNLGVMGWVGSWLSFATATYTAMGVSLGADFAIYLMFRLREEMRVRPPEAALREALRTSGRAIVSVASAIALGCAALLASDFALWRQLGAYVALMMASSALATLTVLPAALLLVRPRFLSRGERDQPA
jgi:hydrophobe/amphiphile efflux-3 (HAE3) family protein